LHVLLSTALTRGWYGYVAGGEVVRFQEGAGFGALVLLPHQEHADWYITHRGEKSLLIFVDNLSRCILKRDSFIELTQYK
jgi:hypothetical protein